MRAHTSSLALWPWVLLGEQQQQPLAHIAEQCGLSQGDLRDPAARVEQAVANHIIALVSERFGPGAAIAAALQVKAGHFQLVEQAVRSTPTVADGLDRLAELFVMVHVGGRVEHARTREGSILRYYDLPGCRVHSGAVELLFAAGLQAIRRETGHDVQPRRVTFMHIASGEHPLYAQVLGADVRFGARTNSVVLDAAVAGLPLLRANAELQARAAGFARQNLASIATRH